MAMTMQYTENTSQTSSPLGTLSADGLQQEGLHFIIQLNRLSLPK